MQRLLLSLAIIVTGLLVGYLIQRLVRRGTLHGDPELRVARKTLQRIALLGLNPVAALSAIWAFELDNVRIALLPVLGVLTVVIGGVSGLGLGRLLKLPRRQAGAFFTSCGMFNIGSIGALIVFMFLGERGFALVPFFRLFEEFSYYAFGFPVAKSFSAAADTEGRRRLRNILVDPFILVSLGSIITGFALNISGLPRPAFFAPLNGFIIPIASLLLLASIGMAMRFGNVGRYLRSSGVVATVKFLIVPVVVVGAGLLFGMHRIDGGLPLQVVLILASMPVGFIALVPPALYDLDVDLANSAWLLTTSLLVVVVPLQMLLVGLIG